MNRGILGFPPSAGADIPVAASAAEVYEGVSPSAIVTPATLRLAMFAYRSIVITGGGSTAGGAAQFFPTNAFLDATATAGGLVVGYGPTSPGTTGSFMSQSSNFLDFRSRRWFSFRIKVEAAASSAGFMRLYCGNIVNSNPIDTAVTTANVGIEFRGTGSRLWLIAHNGTALTQRDTGIDVAVGNFSEYWLESINGVLNLYINGSLRASTSGAPTTLTGASINAFCGNGGVAARTCYVIGPITVNAA